MAPFLAIVIALLGFAGDRETITTPRPRPLDPMHVALQSFIDGDVAADAFEIYYEEPDAANGIVLHVTGEGAVTQWTVDRSRLPRPRTLGKDDLHAIAEYLIEHECWAHRAYEEAAEGVENASQADLYIQVGRERSRIWEWQHDSPRLLEFRSMLQALLWYPEGFYDQLRHDALLEFVIGSPSSAFVTCQLGHFGCLTVVSRAEPRFRTMSVFALRDDEVILDVRTADDARFRVSVPLARETADAHSDVRRASVDPLSPLDS